MEQENTILTETPQISQLKKIDFKKYLPIGFASLLVVLLGIGTGWLLSGRAKPQSTGTPSAPNVKVSENEAGIIDDSFQGDTAEGILEEEGIGNEGTHHLVREGGITKTVYLTSSVIDLQSFVGKKVMVWGQTLSAKKAGWLMDVVKVKVTE